MAIMQVSRQLAGIAVKNWGDFIEAKFYCPYAVADCN